MAAGGEASCKSQPAAPSLGRVLSAAPCVTSLTSPYPHSSSLGLLPQPPSTRTPYPHPTPPTPTLPPPPRPAAPPTGLVRTAEVTQRRASGFAQGGWVGLFFHRAPWVCSPWGFPMAGFPPQRASLQLPTLGMLMASSRKTSGCSSASFSTQTGPHRREFPALHFSSVDVEKGALLS